MVHYQKPCNGIHISRSKCFIQKFVHVTFTLSSIKEIESGVYTPLQISHLMGTLKIGMKLKSVKYIICIDCMGNKLIRTQISPSLLGYNAPLCPLVKSWLDNTW